MSENAALENATPQFVPIKYLIDWRPQGPMEVDGYAFETPGWPEFHACVRSGCRMGSGLFNDWILDHYETGLAISLDGVDLREKEDAPAALAKKLDGLGKAFVTARMAKYGL